MGHISMKALLAACTLQSLQMGSCQSSVDGLRLLPCVQQRPLLFCWPCKPECATDEGKKVFEDIGSFEVEGTVACCLHSCVMLCRLQYKQHTAVAHESFDA